MKFTHVPIEHNSHQWFLMKEKVLQDTVMHVSDTIPSAGPGSSTSNISDIVCVSTFCDKGLVIIVRC